MPCPYIMWAFRPRARWAGMACAGWGAAAALAFALHAAGAAAEEPAATKHFVVYAEAAISARQARRVGGMAERAFEHITGRLGYLPSEPITIVLYGQRDEFFDKVVPPHAVGAVAAPHNIVRIAVWRSRDGLYPVVAHEVSHVVLARALDGNVNECPRWFNEGVATWVSRVWTPADEAQAEELVRGGGALAPAALDSAFHGGDERVRGAYLQSAAMVDYLTRVGGGDAIARIVGEMRRHPDFDSALERAVGLTQEQLYQDWLRELGRRLHWPWERMDADALIFIALGLLALFAAMRVLYHRWRWRREHDDEDGLSQEEIERARELEDLYYSESEEPH